MSGLAPISRTYTMIIPETAQASDFVATVCVAPFDGTVRAATYYPDTAITGADTDSRTFNIHNRGTDGSGTNLAATLAMTSGTNAGQYEAADLALASGDDADNLNVSEGDVLTFESLSVGDGLADPGGTVVIVVGRA